MRNVMQAEALQFAFAGAKCELESLSWWGKQQRASEQRRRPDRGCEIWKRFEFGRAGSRQPNTRSLSAMVCVTYALNVGPGCSPGAIGYSRPVSARFARRFSSFIIRVTSCSAVHRQVDQFGNTLHARAGSPAGHSPQTSNVAGLRAVGRPSAGQVPAVVLAVVLAAGRRA